MPRLWPTYHVPLTEAGNMRPDWRHQYDEARDDAEGDRTIIDFKEPSLTQQHFAKDADLNEIVRRFGIKDGSLPGFEVLGSLDPRLFGDFSEEVDLRTALDIANAAESAFAALPADLRTRFGNDPVSMFQFVNNPKNLDEAVKLGLLKKKPPTLPELGTEDRPITVRSVPIPDTDKPTVSK